VDRRLARLEGVYQRQALAPAAPPPIDPSRLSWAELSELDDLLAIAERAQRQGATDGYTALDVGQQARVDELWARIRVEEASSWRSGLIA
jgi:hypothetical protein